MRKAHVLATGLVLLAALEAPVPGAAGPLAPISLFNQGANGASGGSYPIAGGSGDGGVSGFSYGVSVAGSATITNAGPGISIVSLGGNGGNGGDGIGVILPGFGGNAGGGGHGGALGVSSSAQIFTSGANATGILLLSEAGNGGTGGSGIGIVGGGGNGGGGGQGGFLSVTQRGLVHTDGSGAAGIAAITRGGFGGGPGVGGGLIGYGGSGNASGSGGAITILNSGTIETLGPLSEGVLAQSIGGFGGSGGSGGGLFFFGGVGVTGGDGGAVTVTNRGVIHTGGAESHGVYLQSVGGGGGRGGSGGGLLALGGDGSAGGNGGLVTAVSSGEIATVGDFARGIFAQSIGGGGGSGGATGAAIAIGGRGSSTGFGNTVDVTNTGTVRTRGIDSHALFAQSVGGGGGSGGTAGGWFSFGGRGAAGGNGGAVNVTNRGVLATRERDSAGIFAQSIGGGGGDGGDAGSLGAFLSLAWGGAAGPGGNGARVDVAHETGSIATGGNNSHGIVAQSVGGGGGAGGYAFSGAVGTKFAVSAAIGGSGGAGGAGGAVEVTGAGAITTGGDFAHGVLAESVGGGGGSGGIAIAAAASEGVSASLAIGGTGGSGGSGGKVDVELSGAIETTGLGSAGVFAQSVGGGGGNGGLAVAVSLTIPQPGKTTNFGLSLGGSGGPGGIGGEVDATSRGAIVTRGNEASAIFAQSVGGGGGKGGGSFTAVINPAAAGGQNVNLGIAVGGGGGTGRTGGAVDVSNTGSLTTLRELSHGIFAQSVGGGGGAGGSSRALTVQFGFDSPASNKSAVFSVGGSGGGASDGGAVTVKNTGAIVTQGADSVGIWAQSVGGGGGEGGNGAHGVGNATTLPPGLSATKIYKDLQVVVGGSAGSSGNGAAVRVEQTGLIATSGDGADAIFAQSIGAGGGVGGKAIQGLTGKIAVGGAGGAAGNGGRIDVVLDGEIETFGTAAYGISAASIGGGGGAGGNVDRGFLGFGIVPAFGQGGGSAGDGGAVEIRGTGDITTHGAASHGIFAQSIGGGGGLVGDFGGGLAFAGSVGGDGVGEDVTIVHAGDVRANGAGSGAIFAQSVGPDGNGDVAVTIAAGGTVQGGSGAGVGIQFADGAANRLANAGTVWALSGVAIAGTTGNESLANDGRVVGSVLLGTGVNAFHNRSAGWLDAGSRLDLGGGLLTNDGLLTLGAAGLHRDTLLSGGFQQNATGTTLIRIAPLGGADRLLVAGHAALGGDLTVQRSPGYVVNGTTWEVLHAASLTGAFATETLPAAAPLLAFDVDYRTGPAPGTSVIVHASALPFDTFATTRVGRNTARYLQSIAAITTGGLNLAMGELQVLPLGEHDPAYVALSSETHDAYTTATVDTNKRYGENVREQMRAGRALQRARYADYLISSGGDAQPLPPVGALREFHGLQMWIAPLYDGGTVEEQGGFTGYSADVWGTSAGAQVRLDRRSFFGFSGGFAKTRLDLDQSEGMGQVKSGYATLFGSAWGNRWFGQAMLSYGHHRFEDERLTQFGAIDEVAKSDHDGQSLSLALDLGLDARAIRAWNAAPYASLEYAYLSEDAYTERGPGALLLSVERRDTNSLVSELGVRFVAAPRAFGPVTPELTLGWRHDYDVDARTLSGRFVTGPVTPFALAGRYIQQDAARLGFSLRVDRDDSPFNLTVQTQTLLGSDARDYLANLRFGYAF